MTMDPDSLGVRGIVCSLEKALGQGQGSDPGQGALALPWHQG